MERCLTPHTMETMDWNQVFNDDEDWTFMLNRMDYWSALAKAALISQDTRYLDQAKDFLLDWIEQHPRIEPSLSTRTLDTGIRVVNMLECAMLLEGQKKQAVLSARSVRQSGSYQRNSLVEAGAIRLFLFTALKRRKEELSWKKRNKRRSTGDKSYGIS